MIFNVVVDMVVQNWILIMVYGEVVPEGWGREIQIQAMLFYVNYGQISSTCLECLQGVLDALTRLFVGI